jgi:mRNA interferase RelE/StbE
MGWEVIIMPLAMKQLAAISDKRIQEAITKVLDSLEIEPDKRGKQLTENLSGLWSVRAYRQRYRIIYKLNTEQKEVVVVALGIRREGDRADIYALAKRLIRAGLLTLLTTNKNGNLIRSFPIYREGVASQSGSPPDNEL